MGQNRHKYKRATNIIECFIILDQTLSNTKYININGPGKTGNLLNSNEMQTWKTSKFLALATTNKAARIINGMPFHKSTATFNTKIFMDNKFDGFY